MSILVFIFLAGLHSEIIQISVCEKSINKKWAFLNFKYVFEYEVSTDSLGRISKLVYVSSHYGEEYIELDKINKCLRSWLYPKNHNFKIGLALGTRGNDAYFLDRGLGWEKFFEFKDRDYSGEPIIIDFESLETLDSKN